MHPNPIAVLIRNCATRQFQETQGILYIAQHGGKPQYTVVLEKENIDTAVAQKFVDNMSPLQAILEKQDKSRQQAESIADKIIEEIILQKSKKSMAEKLIREQNEELQKLADDISMQNGMTDSRCVTTSINGNNNNINIMHRQPSAQSIDLIKRSNSTLFRPITNNANSLFTSRSNNTPANQINLNPSTSQPYYLGGTTMTASNSNQNLFNTAPNQFHQSATLPLSFTASNTAGGSMYKKKNELIQSIGNQIERNIKEEQMGFFDTVSENSRFSPRAGSPQLHELRTLTKSDNQGNQDKLETEASALSAINFSTFQLPQTPNSAQPQQYPLNKRSATTNSFSSFDLKDYLKKAIMNKRQSQSGQINISSMNQNGLPYLLTSLSHLDEQQPVTTKESQQSYGEYQNEETLPAAALLKRKHAYSYSQNGGFKFDNFNNNPLSSNQQQQQLQSQHQQHLSTQESKFSQFKGMLATKNDTLDDDLEDLGADIQRKIQSSSSPSHQKTISDLPIPRIKSPANLGSAATTSTTGNAQVSDFVSKINKMLSKSASINLQVENSLQESEKNLQSMNLLSNLNLQAKQPSNTNTSL